MTADLMILFHTSTIGNYIISNKRPDGKVMGHPGTQWCNALQSSRFAKKRKKGKKINEVKRRKLLHNLQISNKN